MEDRVCDLLKIKYPIVQAPIGSATCPELASVVSNAGGLGMLAVSWKDIEQTRQAIRKTKNLTQYPFGVNLVLEWPQIDRLKICLEEGVKIISTFWGDPGEIVKIAHQANAVVIHTVGSAEEAKDAIDKGVDIIVGQGWEAGGHVYGTVSLQTLIPAILDKVPGFPVIAAGGIADGRGIASALALGASGVWIGTRFLASKEANVHPVYKQKILEASENDTAYTTLFDIGWPDAPHRVLKNSTYWEWINAGGPSTGKRPKEQEVIARDSSGHEIRRYSDTIPTPDIEGNLEALALYAGQSAGLIQGIKSAEEIVKQLVKDTKNTVDELNKKIKWAS